MNIEELHAKLGPYHRKHQAQIESFFTQGFASREHLNVITGVQHQYVAKNRHLKDMIQPGMRGFTPHNEKIRIGAEITTVRRAKVNYEIDYDDVKDLEQSAMGKFFEPVGSRPTQIPGSIASLVMNEMLDKVEEEMEMDLLWYGRFKEAAYPNPGPAADVNDGFDKILKDAEAAGKYTPFALGNYGDGEVLEYAEENVLALPIAARRRVQKLYMSVHNQQMCWLNRRQKFGGNTDYNGRNRLMLAGTMIEPVGLPSMGNSKRMFSTMPGNMLMCEDGTREDERLSITLKRDERCIRITADFKVGFGFAAIGRVGSPDLNDQLVFSNDVE